MQKNLLQKEEEKEEEIWHSITTLAECSQLQHLTTALNYSTKTALHNGTY